MWYFAVVYFEVVTLGSQIPTNSQLCLRDDEEKKQFLGKQVKTPIIEIYENWQA